MPWRNIPASCSTRFFGILEGFLLFFVLGCFFFGPSDLTIVLPFWGQISQQILCAGFLFGNMGTWLVTSGFFFFFQSFAPPNCAVSSSLQVEKSSNCKFSVHQWETSSTNLFLQKSHSVSVLRIFGLESLFIEQQTEAAHQKKGALRSTQNSMWNRNTYEMLLFSPSVF